MSLSVGAAPQRVVVEEPPQLLDIERSERSRRFPPGLAMYGPAFVASVAYVDPGNFVTNIQGGARYGYLLMWCVLGASLLAMPVQFLAAKLGVVTGQSLPELSRQSMPPALTVVLWMQAEAVAICTDIAEFVGAAIGLNLIFGVPLALAGAMTGGIAFLILRLQTRGNQRFEVAILASLGLIFAGFAYETLRVGPSAPESLRSLVPHLAGHDSVLIAVGIVGATVMPHAVYLHSALTRDKGAAVDRTHRPRLLASQRADVVIALGAAGVVNMAMLAVAAKVFHHSAWSTLTSLAGAHQGFAQLAGGSCALIFAVALFVSGAASSTVGTMAGQTIMSGYTGRSVPLFLRRAITMAPALALLAWGYNPTQALLYSQVALSFGLPFALVPLIAFTAKRSIMGEHTNSVALTALGSVIAAVVSGLDGLLVYQQIH